MPRTEFLALPMTGSAWEKLLATADADPGQADLTDQDNKHGVRTLAIALVYARTQDPAYRERARQEILEAVGTERVGSNASILALSRQLAAYVLAADFIELSGEDDEAFRQWLADVRTRELGGHGRWRELSATHEDSTNNWGAFAGASRIAASLYLDDAEDIEHAARVLRGFLGDRSAWSRWQETDRRDRTWMCDPESFTPINPPCVRDGIDLDGAIVKDISRGGRLEWPAPGTGIGYTLESLQGLIAQAELLYRNGYPDAWDWSDQALRRAAGLVTRNGEAGGPSWNRSSVNYHVTWLLNLRYGLDLPTRHASFGRVLGYTDWLYGED